MANAYIKPLAEVALPIWVILHVDGSRMSFKLTRLNACPGLILMPSQGKSRSPKHLCHLGKDTPKGICNTFQTGP